MWLHRYLFEIGKGSFAASNGPIRLFWVPALCQIPKDTLWGYSRASHGLIPHFRQIGANRGLNFYTFFTTIYVFFTFEFRAPNPSNFVSKFQLQSNFSVCPDFPTTVKICCPGNPTTKVVSGSWVQARACTRARVPSQS